MSSTTFAFSNAATINGGDYTDGVVQGRNGRTWTQGRVAVSFTGTQFDVTYFAFGGTCKLSVDGVEQSDVPFNAFGGGWGTTTLVSGLSEGLHTIDFVAPMFCDLDAGITVTGASPALSAPSGYATPIRFDDGSKVPDYIRYDGGNQIGSGLGLTVEYAQTVEDLQVTLRTNAPAIQLYGLNFNSVLAYYVDGVRASAAAATYNGAYAFHFLTGLDTGSVHTYQLYYAGPAFVHSMAPVGGSGLSTSAVLPTRRRAVFIGDSISAGLGVSYDRSLNWTGRACAAVDTAIATMAVSGAGMATDGATFVSNVIAALATVDVIWLALGVNDMITAVDPTDSNSTEINAYKSNLSSRLTSLRSAYASAKIYVNYIFKQNAIYDTNGARDTWNAAIRSVVAAKADAKILYADNDNWYTASTGGSLHPTTTGSAEIDPFLRPYVSAAPYTTSGTSGTVTVTLASGGTFDSVEAIILTASAGTITATAASGTITNNGTGAVTVKPAKGATDFAYTADTTATITYTNSQGWPDAATTSYSTADPSLPEVPANLAVAASGAAINVTFDRSTDYADFDPGDLGYNVYKSTDNITYTLLTRIEDTASPSYSDTAVLANTTYYYKVEASSLIFGESARTSEQHTTSNNVPGAPVLDAILGLEVGETGILVEPTAPASDGGSAILTYKIYRKRIGINAAFVLAGTLPAASLGSHFLDTGTADGDTVDYKVTAVNVVGESAASATRETTSQGPHPTGWISSPSGSGLGISISIGI